MLGVYVIMGTPQSKIMKSLDDSHPDNQMKMIDHFML